MANLTIFPITMRASLSFESRAVLSLILKEAMKTQGKSEIAVDEIAAPLALHPERVRGCLMELDAFGWIRLPGDPIEAIATFTVEGVCLSLAAGQLVLGEITRKGGAPVGREQIGLDEFFACGDLYRGTVEHTRNTDGSLSGWCELKIVRNPQDYIDSKRAIAATIESSAGFLEGDELFTVEEFADSMELNEDHAADVIATLLAAEIIDCVEGKYRTGLLRGDLDKAIAEFGRKWTNEVEHIEVTKEFQATSDAWGYFDEFREILDVRFWAERIARALVPDEDETLFVNVDIETLDLLDPDRDEDSVTRIGGAIFRFKEDAADAWRWPGLLPPSAGEEREAS